MCDILGRDIAGHDALRLALTTGPSTALRTGSDGRRKGEQIIVRQIGGDVATGQHSAQTHLFKSLPGGLERDHVQ